MSESMASDAGVELDSTENVALAAFRATAKALVAAQKQLEAALAAHRESIARLSKAVAPDA